MHSIGRQVPGTFQGWRRGPRGRGLGVGVRVRLLAAGFCAGGFALLTSLLGS